MGILKRLSSLFTPAPAGISRQVYPLRVECGLLQADCVDLFAVRLGGRAGRWLSCNGGDESQGREEAQNERRA